MTRAWRYLKMGMLASIVTLLLWQTVGRQTPPAPAHYQNVHAIDMRQDFVNAPAQPSTPSKPPPSTAQPQQKQAVNFEDLDFAAALEAAASPDRKVLLTLIDLGFVPMCVNMYQTCLQPHGIDNYLILGIHQDVCAQLQPYGIHCKTYKTLEFSKEASNYGSKQFNVKTSSRAEMMLQALEANFTVLHSDADMTCFKNMFEQLTCDPGGKCDILSMIDGTNMNYAVGFDLVRPTNGSKSVYRRMMGMAKNTAKTKMNDQQQFHSAIKAEVNTNPNFHVTTMDKKEFPSGLDYYEKGHRYFPDEAAPCPDCVAVQNNWIVSLAAKVYRAKEMHHWFYDGDEYYSSTERQYLTYENTIHAADYARETAALKAALYLGKILNRTVILPKFHCGKGNTHCPLNAVLRVDCFDGQFADRYREHSFLSHPKVPDSVKEAKIGPFLISSNFIMDKQPEVVRNDTVVKFEPKDAVHGMTEKEIVLKFGSISHNVLVFHSLYDAVAENDTHFDLVMKNALIPGGYRQYASMNGPCPVHKA